MEEVEWNSHTLWDDIEDDEYLCLCDYDDDYDIDNNSDFWRRAAD